MGGVGGWVGGRYRDGCYCQEYTESLIPMMWLVQLMTLVVRESRGYGSQLCWQWEILELIVLTDGAFSENFSLLVDP